MRNRTDRNRNRYKNHFGLNSNREYYRHLRERQAAGRLAGGRKKNNHKNSTGFESWSSIRSERPTTPPPELALEDKSFKEASTNESNFVSGVIPLNGTNPSHKLADSEK